MKNPISNICCKLFLISYTIGHCLGRAYDRLSHGQRPRAGGGEDLGDAAQL
jgi:hypothetical protein